MDTPFSMMTPEKRRYWLAWARSHDWGTPHLPHYIESEKLACYGMAHNGKEWIVERAEFTTPREMRNWAGYRRERALKALT